MNAAVQPSGRGRRAVLLLGPALLRHEPPPDPPHTIAVPIVVDGGDPPPNSLIVDVAAAAAGRRAAELAPLFVVMPDAAGGRAYTQMSFNGRDAVFVALDGPPLHGDPAEWQVVSAWVTELGERHRGHRDRLNNHQRWFTNAQPGLEVEHKFTLTGEVDIWGLTVQMRQRIADGELPGWICEHGNNGGFEQWDFLTHIFEINQPDQERGDIAFIPTVDGRWIIRRKQPTGDAAIRREDLTDGIDLGPSPDLAAVIEQRYGLTPAGGGTYRRIRYNVVAESLASGHVFSVMADRCTDQAGHVPDLHQVEVEYVRSRKIHPSDDHLMEDFTQLTDWTRHVLHQNKIAATDNQLTKLRWLRPTATVEDRPP